MAIGGIVELFLGVKAEQAELEDIATPLTAQDTDDDTDDEQPTPDRDAAPRREQARRYRLGPGRTSYSPGMAVSTPITEQEFSREIGRIEAALAEHGTVERRELAVLVGARFWGPGRFQAALRAAVLAGKARRISRTRYGPA